MKKTNWTHQLGVGRDGFVQWTPNHQAIGISCGRYQAGVATFYEAWSQDIPKQDMSLNLAPAMKISWDLLYQWKQDVSFEGTWGW